MDLSPFPCCPPYTPFFLFFFNDTATTEIYTLSLHDALPISGGELLCDDIRQVILCRVAAQIGEDRKSTRLNSSHDDISYAVFCLKKKCSIYTLLTGNYALSEGFLNCISIIRENIDHFSGTEL